VGFFDRFRQKDDLKEAIEKYEKAPTPLATAALVERHVEKEEYENALNVAEKGLAKYPRSEKVLTAYRYAKKIALQDEIAGLRKGTEEVMNPLAYARLADFYRQLGDYERAQDLCNRGIQVYAEHEGNFIVLGTLRHERWKMDHRARDGLKAVEFYRKSLDLNRSSYKTLLALAQIYLAIGAKRQAIENAEAILYFAPADENAHKIVEAANKLPDPGRLEVDELFRQHEEKKLGEAKRRAELGGVGSLILEKLLRSPDALSRKLAFFKDLDGIQWALAIDQADRQLGSYIAQGELSAAVQEQVCKIFHAAQDCSYNMDIGSFRRLRVEGPFGYLCIIPFEDIYFAILCGPSAKLIRLEDMVMEFIENYLYLD
jgi:tetratricopeptide (TPR) repeat protein